eukprot:EC800086.1.p3 GENE.EC800086.1~~EC800086.1.p3  ORF type:complete len:110 (+),score=37.34 EC800086.1:440-769(+)
MEHKGLSTPDEDDSPAKGAFITFISFILFGALPLLAFLVFGEFDTVASVTDKQFILSMCLTAFALFVLGAFKDKLVRPQWWKGGLIMTINGGIATGLAFLVGWLLQNEA